MLRISRSFLLSNLMLLLYPSDCLWCGEFRNQSQHNQCCTRRESGNPPGDTFEHYAKGGPTESPTTPSCSNVHRRWNSKRWTDVPLSTPGTCPLTADRTLSGGGLSVSSKSPAGTFLTGQTASIHQWLSQTDYVSSKLTSPSPWQNRVCYLLWLLFLSKPLPVSWLF